MHAINASDIEGLIVAEVCEDGEPGYDTVTTKCKDGYEMILSPAGKISISKRDSLTAIAFYFDETRCGDMP